MHTLLYPLVVETVKNSPAMQETWVPFLGQKEPLERDVASHSGVRACRVPRARGLAGTAPGIAELGTAPGYSHDLHRIEQNDSRKGV